MLKNICGIMDNESCQEKYKNMSNEDKVTFNRIRDKIMKMTPEQQVMVSKQYANFLENGE